MNEAKDYDKPKNIGGVFDDKYIDYNSNGSKKLSIEQYLQKIRPHYLYYKCDKISLNHDEYVLDLWPSFEYAYLSMRTHQLVEFVW